MRELRKAIANKILHASSTQQPIASLADMNSNEPDMNVKPARRNKRASMAMSTSGLTKSALAMQLEQFDSGTFVSAPVHSSAAIHSSGPIHPDGAVPPAAKSAAQERQLLRKLTKMIADERWREMDELLRSPGAAGGLAMDLEKTPPNPNGLSGMSGCAGDVNPMEIVHYACRFNPPRTIVRHLLTLYPKGLSRPDKLGRLPLHHAAKWNASYRLIDFLLMKDPSAAAVQDNLGKIPLHLLCENYAHSEEPSNRDDLSAEDNLLEAAKALVAAAPEAINLEDNSDTTAIEYAVMSDAPYHVVRYIQKASEKDWKERGKKGGTHKQMEEGLARECQEKQRAQETQRNIVAAMQNARPVTKRKPTYARTA